MNIYTKFKIIKVTSARSKSGGLWTKLHLPDAGPRVITYNFKYNNHLDNALAYLEERPALYTIVGTTDNNEIIVA
jgi:hypothetical protein